MQNTEAHEQQLESESKASHETSGAQLEGGAFADRDDVEVDVQLTAERLGRQRHARWDEETTAIRGTVVGRGNNAAEPSADARERSRLSSDEGDTSECLDCAIEKNAESERS